VVWSASGLVEIETLRDGDLVLVRDAPGGPIGLRPVTRRIVTQDAALLEVRVDHGAGGVEAIQATDEHPFYVAGRGWTRADLLRPGDGLVGLRGQGGPGAAVVVSLAFGSRRATVYNLSVDGSASYLVGPDGVWVHNCDLVDNLGSHVVDTLHH
jgi:hypothetical protein